MIIEDFHQQYRLNNGVCHSDPGPSATLHEQGLSKDYHKFTQPNHSFRRRKRKYKDMESWEFNFYYKSSCDLLAHTLSLPIIIIRVIIGCCLFFN